MRARATPPPLPLGRRRASIPIGGALVLGLLAVSLTLGWFGGSSEKSATRETGGAGFAHGTPSHPGISPPAHRPHGGVARVSVTDRGRQRIQGWGTSVTSADDPLVDTNRLSTAELRRLDRIVFRKAGFNLVRVFGPGPQDGDDEVGVWPGSDRRLDFMRRVRRFGVRFAFTGGGAPPSMRLGDSAAGALEPGFERDYARFLAENLEAADRAGAPFRWAGIGNETDLFGAFWVAMKPAQAAAVYLELATQIRQRRLGTRLMLGDNEGWAKTYEYARHAFASRRVRRLSTVVATHPYSNAAPPAMRSVARFAARRRLSLWMTEFSLGCPTCPDSGDIRDAIRFANQISYDLNVAQVRAWFTFPAGATTTHGAFGAMVVFPDGGSQPFYASKRFPIIRQFTSAARPGARRYRTRESDPALQTVAFRRGRATTLVVTNNAHGSRLAEIDMGRHGGALRARRTTQQDDFRLLPARRYIPGGVRTQLPALSVTTFRLIPNGGVSR